MQQRNVIMILYCTRLIAAVGNDFIGFSVPVPLVFDGATTTLPVTITIIDDSVLENNEHFLSLLRTDDPTVVLDPQQATINIQEDNDSTFCYEICKY